MYKEDVVMLKKALITIYEHKKHQFLITQESLEALDMLNSAKDLE